MQKVNICFATRNALPGALNYLYHDIGATLVEVPMNKLRVSILGLEAQALRDAVAFCRGDETQADKILMQVPAERPVWTHRGFE